MNRKQKNDRLKSIVQKRSRKMLLEQLEDRTLLAAGLQFTVEFYEDDGGVEGEVIEGNEVPLNAAFYAKLSVCDVPSGVIGLQANVGWNSEKLEANPTPNLLTREFPLFRETSLDNVSGQIQVAGGSLPAAGLGEAIGIREQGVFSTIAFRAEQLGMVEFSVSISEIAFADGTANVNEPFLLKSIMVVPPPPGEIDVSVESISFETSLSEFRNAVHDSPLVRPSFPAEEIIEITNSGDGPLTLLNATVNVPDVSISPGLTSSHSDDLVLEPGEVTQFTVRFTPSHPTVGNASSVSFNHLSGIVIESDAANNPFYSVALVGASTFDSDLSYDGMVSVEDLGVLNANFGRSEGDSAWDPTSDINADGRINHADLGPLNAEFGRSIHNVNVAPIVDDLATRVAEDAPVGTRIGTVDADDADGDDLSFSIVAGNIDEVFAIDDAGAITVASNLSFHATPVYQLQVKVEDGHGDSAVGFATIHLIPEGSSGTSATETAEGNLRFLNEQMDEYHRYYYVYDDVSSAGNSFHSRALIPDEHANVTMNGASTDSYTGATSMEFEFIASGNNFGGVYMLNGVLPPNEQVPQPNFGEIDAGVDLSGVQTLSFFAKGAEGGERIEWFVGGVGRDAVTGAQVAPYPGSSPRYPSIGTDFVLDDEWREIRIPVGHLDLSKTYGMGWVANALKNPRGVKFWVDQMRFELSEEARFARLNEPRFVRSFRTDEIQPDIRDDNLEDDFHLALRSAASTYDQAVVILSYLADFYSNGRADSLRRAKLVGEALLYASHNDRTYDNGMVRSFYNAGNLKQPPGWIPNGRAFTVSVAGMYDEQTQTFLEVEQDNIDVGTQAFVAISLQQLFRVTKDQEFLDAAVRIGKALRQFRADTGTYQGFKGGIDNPESVNPTMRQWASTEQNLDLIVMYDGLFELLGDVSFYEDARHAESFVSDMWSSELDCYYTGTINSETINKNPDQLPSDVNSWAILAMPELRPERQREILACLASNHVTHATGYTGIDFNSDNDSVWPEGTAHFVLASQVAGFPGQGEYFGNELRRIQYDLGSGIVASTEPTTSTGFGFQFYAVPHISATAWWMSTQLHRNLYFVHKEIDDLLAASNGPDDDFLDSVDKVFAWLGDE